MKKDKKKEVSEEMLMKTVKKMSLQNCVLWSNKIENHIGSLREMIQKRQRVVSFNKFYDNDNKRGNIIVDKLNSLQRLLNAIYERINDLAQEEIGYDFEIEKFSNLDIEMDEAFLKAKANAEKTAKEEFKKRVEQEKMVGPETPIKTLGK